jgi:hypothetical protein
MRANLSNNSSSYKHVKVSFFRQKLKRITEYVIVYYFMESGVIFHHGDTEFTEKRFFIFTICKNIFRQLSPYQGPQ